MSRASPKNEPKRQKNWQHPANRKIRVPRKAAAAVAILEMGITDPEKIAAAVDLPVAEVERIERAEDPLFQKLLGAGIPYGVYFPLRQKIRCPKCDGWILIAPCVLCDRRVKPVKGGC